MKKIKKPEFGVESSDCTYFLCPDKKCDLFSKPNCHVPCERECPKKAKKMIVCWSCKKEIKLPFNHFSFDRVDCKCGASNFQRLTGNYRRIKIQDLKK